MNYQYMIDISTGDISTKIILKIDIDGLASIVPLIQGNSDYAHYLAWIAQGNVPLAAAR